MAGWFPLEQRGLANGLITGASVMGAVFALASRADDLTTAPPDAIALGMRVTVAVAAGLVVVALVIALASMARARPARPLAS